MMRSPVSRWGAAAVVAAAAAALSFVPASAQIPDKFTNLHVLPKDIAKPDLIAEMRGYSGALGVRCAHCHVGKNPDTLEGFDFASDEKEPKAVARAMMKMVDEINSKLVPATGRLKVHKVSCVTCHRGATLPLTLQETLIETADKDGADAVIAQYRDLHEKHLSDGLYDFRAPALASVVEHLANERKDVEGGLKLARLNVEFHPAEPFVHSMVAQLCLAKGDKACALESFQKAAELAPSNQMYKKQIEALKAEAKP